MYAIEFETEVENRCIKIPQYEKFKFKHVKVVLMAETANKTDNKKYNFNDLLGKLEWHGDAVSAQRELRNEW
jgi:hypothetical protein